MNSPEIETHLKIILEDLHPLARRVSHPLFLENGFRIEMLDRLGSSSELGKRLENVHIFGTRSKTQLSAETLNQGKQLMALGCFCIGTDHVDLDSALKRGIPVFNASIGNSRSVAEMILAELIMLSRHLGQRSMEMHQKNWHRVYSNSFEIRGKVLGIVGYGHIGSQVSILAEALGMKVLFYDIRKKLPIGNARACSSLEELLKQSNFITIHVPATPLTYQMIGNPQVQLMKKGSYLLNASRGSVVDLSAVRKALKSEYLAGAAIDVFPDEPEESHSPFESELQGLPNVILTPHIGGATEEAQKLIATEVTHALIQFIKTGSIQGAVNFPEIQFAPLKPHPLVMADSKSSQPSSSRRILNVYQNTKDHLEKINQIKSHLGIAFQNTQNFVFSELGYSAFDLEECDCKKFQNALQSLETSLQTRTLPLF